MAAERPTPGNGARAKYKIITIGVMVFVVIFGWTFFRDENEQIPDELVGRWITADERYSDRFF